MSDGLEAEDGNDSDTAWVQGLAQVWTNSTLNVGQAIHNNLRFPLTVHQS